jgi:hypothetical protein
MRKESGVRSQESGVRRGECDALVWCNRKDTTVMPDWMHDREVRAVMSVIGLAGLIAFLFMVWLFAFYW